MLSCPENREAKMPDLPCKKVGIIACSGEELAEGTVSRLAALQVLEELRPSDTVTICLPLFLAGGEGDRAFAKFYPTIAIDGCERRCAARGTEIYSAKPAASIVITELAVKLGLSKVEGKRQLNQAGQQVLTAAAGRASGLVDELLHRHWDRTAGSFAETTPPAAQEAAQATCSCGSGIPVQEVVIHGQPVILIALPLLFEQFRDSGRPASADTTRDLLEAVRIYNPIPAGEDEAYAGCLAVEYAAFLEKQGASQ
jgi:uncharacterized metal-binding protein